MSAPAAASQTIALMQSPLWSVCARFASASGTRNGYRVVESIDHAERYTLKLCDLTHLARCGLRGTGAADRLRPRGAAVPTLVGTWVHDAGGGAIARLGEHEYLLTDLPCGAPTTLHPPALETPGVDSTSSCVQPLQHAQACIGIAGATSAELLARLCALDLRPTQFAAHGVTRTQVAGVAATVMRCDGADGTLAFLLFVDSALARYLWDLLDTAAATLDGGVVGAGQFH